MLTRVTLSVHFQRWLMIFAIALNSHNAWNADWLWLKIIIWIFVAVFLVLVWFQERSRLLLEEARTYNDELKWTLAAASDDPMGSMAVMSYLDNLSRRDYKDLTEWFGQQQRVADEHGEVTIDMDDMPPVVRRMFEAGLKPPQER